MAKAFARRWGGGTGEYCFETDVASLERMAGESGVAVSLPMLDYRHDEERGITAAAQALSGGAEAYAIRGCALGKATAEKLQSILAENGARQGGTKDALRRRLAGVAAEQYRRRLPELERYFAERQFIRAARAPAETLLFPVLEDAGALRHLLTAMYALRHLRGEAILDAGHVNDTYDDESSALALIEGRVSAGGAFLEAG